jgi:hypothetical protein
MYKARQKCIGWLWQAVNAWLPAIVSRSTTSAGQNSFYRFSLEPTSTKQLVRTTLQRQQLQQKATGVCQPIQAYHCGSLAHASRTRIAAGFQPSIPMHVALLVRQLPGLKQTKKHCLCASSARSQVLLINPQMLSCDMVITSCLPKKSTSIAGPLLSACCETSTVLQNTSYPRGCLFTAGTVQPYGCTGHLHAQNTQGTAVRIKGISVYTTCWSRSSGHTRNSKHSSCRSQCMAV